jgi:hypothetical protein
MGDKVVLNGGFKFWFQNKRPKRFKKIWEGFTFWGLGIGRTETRRLFDLNPQMYLEVYIGGIGGKSEF